MKKVILWGIFSLWCLFAQNVFAAPELIHLQKGSQHLYLWGTVHIAKPSYYPLPKAVLANLDNTDALALELDLSSPRVAEQVRNLTLHYAVDPNQNLSSLLTAKELVVLEQLLGDKLPALAQFKPIMLMTFAIFSEAEKLGFTAQGVDQYLQEYAQKNQIKIIGLESPAEQMKAFVSVSYDESLAWLKDMLRDPSELAKQVHNVGESWEKDSPSLLNEYMAEMKRDAPSYYDNLIIKRNEIMAKRIEQFNQIYPNLFVAVGDLHVIGEKNIVGLLLHSGYKRVEN